LVGHVRSSCYRIRDSTKKPVRGNGPWRIHDSKIGYRSPNFIVSTRPARVARERAPLMASGVERIRVAKHIMMGKSYDGVGGRQYGRG
jgi:hypothetical protein